MKVNTDNLNLNNMIIVLGVLGVAYMVYKGSQGIKKIGDVWGGLDLNPFDSGSFLTDLFKDIDLNPFDSKPSAAATENAAIYEAARLALKLKGKDIDNYVRYTGSGGKLPADSWKVTYKGKIYYYVPKYANTYYSDEAGAGTFG